MWLRLGDNELINLSYIASVKKADEFTLELYFTDFRHTRVLPFTDEKSREEAFLRLVNGLARKDLLLE